MRHLISQWQEHQKRVLLVGGRDLIDKDQYLIEIIISDIELHIIADDLAHEEAKIGYRWDGLLALS